MRCASMRRMALSNQTFPTERPREPLASVLPRIRSGDLLLCAGTGVFSTLIQQATGSIWSHVGLLWHWPGVDRVVVATDDARIFKAVEAFGGDFLDYGKGALARRAARAIGHGDEAGAEWREALHGPPEAFGHRIVLRREELEGNAKLRRLDLAARTGGNSIHLRQPW